jgi:hypothetical protein
MTQAQDWSFFPKDSLRCYTINDYGRLMGIDFRDHFASENDSIIHLDSFGKFIALDTQINGVLSACGGSIFFRDRNSHFGNRIVTTAKGVEIIFTDPFDKSIKREALSLIADNRIGTSWVFFENDEVLVKARVTSLGLGKVYNRTDSIKTIHLWAFNKKNPDDSLLYNIRVGKQFGVFEIPRLSGFIQHDQRSYYSSIEHWMPYREMSAYRFLGWLQEGDIHYKCWMSDITEYLRVRKRIVGGSFVMDYKGYRVEFLGFEEVDTTFSNNVQDYKWYRANDILWSTIPDGVFDTLTFEYIEHAANPIPGRIVMVRGVVLDPQVSLRCDSTYSLHFSGYEGYSLFSWRLGYPAGLRRHNKDIFYTRNGEGETRDDGRFSVSYGETVGYMGCYGYNNSNIYGDFHSSVVYHPNEKCKDQDPIRFASIDNQPAINQLKVYPNPVSDLLKIPKAKGKSLHFAIHNLSGIAVSSGSTSGIIRLDDLANGLYILQVTEGSQIFRVKINILH